MRKHVLCASSAVVLASLGSCEMMSPGGTRYEGKRAGVEYLAYLKRFQKKVGPVPVWPDEERPFVTGRFISGTVYRIALETYPYLDPESPRFSRISFLGFTDVIEPEVTRWRVAHDGAAEDMREHWARHEQEAMRGKSASTTSINNYRISERNKFRRRFKAESAALSKLWRTTSGDIAR